MLYKVFEERFRELDGKGRKKSKKKPERNNK